jgi:hypothetical protein
MPDHVSAPLVAAKDELEAINIENAQMRAPMAPFCVNLTLPYLSHEVHPLGTMSGCRRFKRTSLPAASTMQMHRR